MVSPDSNAGPGKEEAAAGDKTQGQLAQYIVNGSGSIVESASRSVEISNGVTVTMLAGDAGN